MHLRAQYQGILTSLDQLGDEQTPIQPTNKVASQGGGKGNQTPHPRSQQPNRSRLPKIPRQNTRG